MDSTPYMFFFCPETGRFSSIFQTGLTEKYQKKGLKKGVWWFRMVSSGRKWWMVAQSEEHVEAHVKRKDSGCY